MTPMVIRQLFATGELSLTNALETIIDHWLYFPSEELLKWATIELASSGDNSSCRSKGKYSLEMKEITYSDLSAFEGAVSGY